MNYSDMIRELQKLQIQLSLFSARIQNQAMQEDTSLYNQDESEHEKLPYYEPLTPRECEVLHQLPTGLTYAEIGVELSIKQSTVNQYIKQIYAKFGVNNRQAAINRGRKLGYLE
ncbi:MAG: helix-turn-helix transcriptional regulator [Chloroflexota bacterium]